MYVHVGVCAFCIFYVYVCVQLFRLRKPCAYTDLINEPHSTWLQTPIYYYIYHMGLDVIHEVTHHASQVEQLLIMYASCHDTGALTYYAQLE